MSDTDWAVRRDPSGEKLPWWTSVLTLFLLFHLTVLFITPNRQNFFGQRFGNFFKPYVNFFEFSSDWTFFSPDPGPPIYIDWKVFDEAGKEIATGTYPDSKNHFVVGDRQVRRVSAARFMIMQDGVARNSLAPYLCGSTPNAFSVRMSRVLMYPPILPEILDGKKEINDTANYDRADLGLEFCDHKSAKSF